MGSLCYENHNKPNQSLVPTNLFANTFLVRRINEQSTNQPPNQRPDRTSNWPIRYINGLYYNLTQPTHQLEKKKPMTATLMAVAVAGSPERPFYRGGAFAHDEESRVERILRRDFVNSSQQPGDVCSVRHQRIDIGDEKDVQVDPQQAPPMLTYNKGVCNEFGWNQCGGPNLVGFSVVCFSYKSDDNNLWQLLKS